MYDRTVRHTLSRCRLLRAASASDWASAASLWHRCSSDDALSNSTVLRFVSTSWSSCTCNTTLPHVTMCLYNVPFPLFELF